MQSARDGSFYLLRFDLGEPLLEALTEWARLEKIEAAAVISGIGMVKDTEVGYWRGTAYESVTIAEPLELLALTGSIAVDEHRPSLHLHAIGGKADHTTVGGHLLKSTVAVVAEVGVRTFPGQQFHRSPLPGSPLRALTFSGRRTAARAPARHGGPARARRPTR